MTTRFINNDVKPESHSRLFWLISDSWVLAKRSIRHITRNLDQLFSVALFPIMFFLLFRYVFGGATGSNPTKKLTPITINPVIMFLTRSAPT